MALRRKLVMLAQASKRAHSAASSCNRPLPVTQSTVPEPSNKQTDAVSLGRSLQDSCTADELAVLADSLRGDAEPTNSAISAPERAAAGGACGEMVPQLHAPTTEMSQLHTPTSEISQLHAPTTDISQLDAPTTHVTTNVQRIVDWSKRHKLLSG